MTSACVQEACSAELVSSVEQSTGLCMTCIVTRAALYPSTVISLRTETERARALEAELATAREALSRRGEMLRVEVQGREARARGLGLDQNPYEAEEERLMWANGWSQEEGLEALARSVAVMRWAAGAVELVAELAEGEVRHKLETVRDKLAEHVEELS